MSKLDAHTSEISHARHLIPIWLALPPENRGLFTSTKPSMVKFLKSKGVTNAKLGRPRNGPEPITLVSSFVDAQIVRNRRRIFVEHGAGQRYEAPRLATNGSYSGGDGHEGTAAFLCPSQTVADRWARYNVPRFVVGAPPYLDPWLSGMKTLAPADKPVIAVSFHWNGERFCSELRSAWGTFRAVMPALCRQYTVLAHGHPRSFDKQIPQWEKWGAEIVPDYDDILERAHALVVDNSSIAYEFAALDRPVLMMREPSWDPDANHGLRFYSHVPGLDCGDPRHLLNDLADTLAGDAYAMSRRVLAAKAAYSECDGRSTERAVNACLEVLRRYAR